MALKAVIAPSTNIRGSVSGTSKVLQAQALAVSGGISMADLTDVDLEAPVTGAIMTYNAEEGKFKVITDIDAPTTRLIGGSF